MHSDFLINVSKDDSETSFKNVVGDIRSALQQVDRDADADIFETPKADENSCLIKVMTTEMTLREVYNLVRGVSGIRNVDGSAPEQFDNPVFLTFEEDRKPDPTDGTQTVTADYVARKIKSAIKSIDPYAGVHFPECSDKSEKSVHVFTSLDPQTVIAAVVNVSCALNVKFTPTEDVAPQRRASVTLENFLGAPYCG